MYIPTCAGKLDKVLYSLYAYIRKKGGGGKLNEVMGESSAKLRNFWKWGG